LVISSIIRDDFGEIFKDENDRKAPAVTKRKETLYERILKINSTEDLLKKAEIKGPYSTAKTESKKQLINLKTIPTIRDKIPTLQNNFSRSRLNES